MLANADQDLSKPIEDYYVTPSSAGRLRTEASVSKTARSGLDDAGVVIKITAHAAVRHQAMHMVDRTLASLLIAPLQTNKDRLRNILANNSYQAGRCDAEFVRRMEAEQLSA